MNRIHRTLFNARTGTHVAAAETARSRGKGSAGVAGTLLASALLSTSALAQLAPGALPTGGQVSAGQASIATSGNAMTVTQTSSRAAINWQSFNIGAGASVQFNQPHASAVVLNRVVGNEGSVIDGALRANGQVWLVNPNGVLFNSGARVDVGALVASTRGISDADFMAGKSQLTGSGTGDVVNHGAINAADGGYIALIGRAVKNDGVITARLGTVAAAAGDKVTLNFGGDSLVGVAIDEGTLDALVRNGGAIRADGGQIVLTARTASALLDAVVNNTGELRAQTVASREGRILLLADMTHGRTEVAGTLDASAPNGGHGGFIETSAADVRIQGGTTVTTAAPNGTAGTWLIDPTDFTIGWGSAPQTGSGIGQATLEAALAAGNVTIQTLAAGSDSGNINVRAAVAWSAHQLSLQAHGDINVQQVMSATGTATLDLKTGYDGTSYVDATKTVRVGFASDGSFSGRIDFDRSGSGILTINGQGYTLINSLGAAGSTTGTDLQGIEANAAGRYALASNIDASPTATWNAGAGFEPLAQNAGSFTGVFDGLGHTIDGLVIHRSGMSIGLFNSVAGTAVLRNVGVTNASITNPSYANGSDYYTGVLAGYLYGNSLSQPVRVHNVYVTGTMTIGNGAGGIAGGADYAALDLVRSAVNMVSPNGGYGVGGLIGEASGVQVSRSYVDAVSIQGENYLGGLIGATGQWSGGSGIQMSYSLATIQASGSNAYNVGGLVGGAFGPLAIANSYALGSVTDLGIITGQNAGIYGVGGLVGTASSLQLTNSYASAVVSTPNTSASVNGLFPIRGGLVASIPVANPVPISSYWDAQVSGIPGIYANGSYTNAGTPLSTAALQTASSLSGWDFTTVWRENTSGVGPYYLLRWQDAAVSYLAPPPPPPAPQPAPAPAPAAQPAPSVVSLPGVSQVVQQLAGLAVPVAAQPLRADAAAESSPRPSSGLPPGIGPSDVGAGSYAWLAGQGLIALIDGGLRLPDGLAPLGPAAPGETQPRESAR